MLIAAFSYRLPPQGWQPDGWQKPNEDTRSKLITTANVDIDQALRTPQFYQLWIVLCLNVTAGIGVLGVARTMITEIFGTTLPQTVDTAFAATYVVMISAFNMVGRFIWASASDYLGRRNTYWIFFLLGIALYLSSPLHGAAGKCQPVNDLAGVLLRRHDDYFHHVWRWICHDTCVSSRYFRHTLRGWHSRSPADRLEHRWRAGTFSNHITEAKLSHQSD